MGKIFVNYKDVGKRISKRRSLLKITQEKLAEKVGLETNTIAKIESQGAGVSVEALVSISAVLRVTPNYLLSGSEMNCSMVEKVAGKLNVLSNEEHLKIVSGLIDVITNLDVVGL